MGNLSQSSHPDLLVDVGDDAAVWAQPGGKVLISTADFFGPLVDDPYLWGQIASANAASDVYAMGGKPLFALNLVCWPGDGLELDVLSEVLAGGAATAERGGWNVVGGHTVTGPEPLYGQAVTGEARADSLLTLAGGQEGQAIVLTKPLGTGIITTAAMRRPTADAQPGGDMHDTYQAAIAEMLRLNDTASQIAKDAGATAATDITGFGLLGHLKKLCEASSVGAEIDVASIPILPGAIELALQGYAPGGAQRNLDYVAESLDLHALGAAPTHPAEPADQQPPPHNSNEPLHDANGPQKPAITLSSVQALVESLEITDLPDLTSVILLLLADPQTSGGLLFTCPPESVPEALAALTATNHTAAQIGSLTASPLPSLLDYHNVAADIHRL